MNFRDLSQSNNPSSSDLPKKMENGHYTLEAIIAKTLQECQNGLLSSLNTFNYNDHSKERGLIPAVVNFGRRHEAEIQVREGGVDFLLPRVVVTVEFLSNAVIVSAHRLSSTLE